MRERIQTLITPDMAMDILSKNDRNRKLNESSVRTYAQQMKKGQWHDTHHGIAIFEDGNLADGQNRLHAIIRSGCPQKMWIDYGIKLEAALAIDNHKPRSIPDRIRIGYGDRWFDNSTVAILRMLFAMKNKLQDFNADRLVKMVDESIKERIDFARIYTVCRKGFASSPYLAALSTAYSNEPTDRLLEFCKIIDTGIAKTDDDMAAIRIRDFIQSNKVNESIAAKKDCFLRTQRAIQAFCLKQRIKKLYVPNEIIYPVYI